MLTDGQAVAQITLFRLLSDESGKERSSLLKNLFSTIC
jgi:hypothetical protein